MILISPLKVVSIIILGVGARSALRAGSDLAFLADNHAAICLADGLIGRDSPGPERFALCATPKAAHMSEVPKGGVGSVADSMCDEGTATVAPDAAPTPCLWAIVRFRERERAIAR